MAKSPARNKYFTWVLGLNKNCLNLKKTEVLTEIKTSVNRLN